MRPLHLNKKRNHVSTETSLYQVSTGWQAMGSNFLYDDECTVSRDSAKDVTLTWYNSRGHKHEAAIGVRNFPIFFRIFPKKAPGRRKKKKSLFPRISPYFPVFPPLPAYEYTAMQKWSCGRMPMGNLIVCLSPGTYLNTCQTSAEESGRSLSAASSMTSWPFYRK